MKNAVVVEETTDTTTVRVGTFVTVFDEDLDETEKYEITGSMEANALLNKISNESPMGAALLGKKVGDVATVKAPDGDYKLRVMAIELA